ncbi:hypothetical protein [Paraburkholderia caribensis]|uniref:hypothetical protein n=1 Tax=Paraburkholderia caribensis TaxID=75105 RepID=UPI001314FAA5|nr:hypothetical protein [Paraburkholderia caribensis]
MLKLQKIGRKEDAARHPGPGTGGCIDYQAERVNRRLRQLFVNDYENASQSTFLSPLFDSALNGLCAECSEIGEGAYINCR